MNNVVGYFGSELNEFIHENCTKEMTAINIDLLLHRRSRKKFRIIESKHINERTKNGQRKALDFLALILKNAQKYFPGWDFGVFIVYGNKPYNSLDILDLISRERFRIVGKDNVISWLELNT